MMRDENYSTEKRDQVPGEQATASGVRDEAGLETLEIMRVAPRFNRWQYDQISPYLGQRICEVGSGVGNISEFLLEAGKPLVVLTDPDEHYRRTLRSLASTNVHVKVEELELPDSAQVERLRRYSLDTVLAMNVLEHIQDEFGAVKCMVRLLGSAGRVIILVPALTVLYGSLDRELGHVRRYTRRSLSNVMSRAGLQIERVFYFNLVGCLGWWLNSRVLQRKRIPKGQLRLFDSVVPLLRFERVLGLPFGQSVIGIGRVP
jgi:SAM-dependent methyltransferase